MIIVFQAIFARHQGENIIQSNIIFMMASRVQNDHILHAWCDFSDCKRSLQDMQGLLKSPRPHIVLL